MHNFYLYYDIMSHSFINYRNVLLTLFCHAALLTAAPAQQRMSLDNAISIGMKNNYDILMARNTEEAAANDYHYAFGAFLPSLEADASQTWSVTDVNQTHFDGSKQERNNSHSKNLNLSANLDWTLFDGLRMFATKDKLRAIQESGELGIKNQIINSITDIIAAYYDIVQQKEQLQSIAEQMSISGERVKIADNKFKSGLGSKIDLLQAQVDLNAEKAAYLRQQTTLEQTKATLNQLIALPATNEYDVADSIPVNLDLQYQDMQQEILDSNVNLLLAQKNIAISQLSLKEIQRSRLPTISFVSSYSYSKQNSQAGQLLFNQSNGLQYGFSAAIPIFSRFDINRQAKSAQLDIQYQQLAFENQKSQVSVELQNAFKEYDYARKALKLEQENLGIAEENVQVALEAFRQGQTSTLEVKEAQDGLADARYRLISAQYGVKIAETNILKLKGDILK